jgi:hypothetical protein
MSQTVYCLSLGFCPGCLRAGAGSRRAGRERGSARRLHWRMEAGNITLAIEIRTGRR